ncbi:GNAT family N-acetyltransferase [Paracraurococcus ruber]|uniref:GNAT family N-acetyltransferase n=1 Tax=Paracraurococcus ruber TaxID=77675 RepID=A0ABS1CWK7_9PROT|nr:GNAT family N-acetyltransferase [Paracraurococcus ruber]MBK1658901.1 GNAT family N-acetyltransferase [Paracraurococcus ruber]TDG30857.1 GNAT family N-acetyltransferase [Paracraurococcus ruber]
MSLRLRDATPDDLGLVLHFVRALADYEKLLHEVLATEEDFRSLLFGTPARAEALIAEWDGAPVGFALWYHSVSTFDGRAKLYVEDVFVNPDQRGRGIGRAIFADLARRAVAQGCSRMEWSVLDWNAPSIAFYRSIGALPREGWTLQRLGGDALAALAASGDLNG